MKIIEYGNKESDIILIQVVDNYDLSFIDKEIELIKESIDQDFLFLVCIIDSWNDDLSPWPAKAVFGNQDFGSGADKTLNELLKYLKDDNKHYILGGYSLAGLFSLYASSKTNRFEGIVSVSSSLWFPNFLEYLDNNEINTKNIYLSLGNKESNTKNKVMKEVENKTLKTYELIKNKNINSIYEINEGNHFKDPDIRMLKGFIWMINQIK